MKFVSHLGIRPLGPEDAQRFLEVHHAAVHGSARSEYPPDVLEAWSGPIDGMRRDDYLRKAGEEIRIGAFDGEVLAGFGALAPHEGELRACYVHPDYGRQGVGARLVGALERIAAAMGLRRLELDSSINAEKFYASLGYACVARGMHRLSNGMQMPSVRMSKLLAEADDMETLKKRNLRVETDKAWETSWTRRAVIVIITYSVVAAWLALLGVKNHMLHALVPVAGYLLSMMTLPMLKDLWVREIYKRRHP